jgi:hypothetical protein
MVRTLGENDPGVPARSPSGEKGDLDDPPQPKTSRDDAGSWSEKGDLMSPLSRIIDIQGAEPISGQPASHRPSLTTGGTRMPRPYARARLCVIPHDSSCAEEDPP